MKNSMDKVDSTHLPIKTMKKRKVVDAMHLLDFDFDCLGDFLVTLVALECHF